MKAMGFRGYSGSGKTTLVEQLVRLMKAAGLRVSVVKHAHHRFDIDHPGKDSWRHRQAGAFEVVIGSDQRLALMREYEAAHDPSVHDLIRELSPCDWVLVEGFKRDDALPKIEVWRASTGHPLELEVDAQVVAVCTDDASALAAALANAPTVEVLDLNDPQSVVDFLRASGERFAYRPPARNAP